MLPLRRDGKNFVLLGLANLSVDALSQLELILGDIPIDAKSWQLKRLGQYGRTEIVSGANVGWIDDRLKIKCRLDIQYMDIAVLILEPKP